MSFILQLIIIWCWRWRHFILTFLNFSTFQLEYFFHSKFDFSWFKMVKRTTVVLLRWSTSSWSLLLLFYCMALFDLPKSSVSVDSDFLPWNKLLIICTNRIGRRETRRQQKIPTGISHSHITVKFCFPIALVCFDVSKQNFPRNLQNILEQISKSLLLLSLSCYVSTWLMSHSHVSKLWPS